MDNAAAVQTMIDGWVSEESHRRERADSFMVQALDRMPLLAEGLATFGGTQNITDVFGPAIYWCVPVDSFIAALPLIEFIESFAGECKSSKDWPEYRQRDFTFDGISLSCTLQSDTESCRVVVKGYKAPEPILEFVCEQSV